MSCVNWAMPGCEEAFILGSSWHRWGWAEKWIQILGFIFPDWLPNFTLHTFQLKTFFSLLLLKDLRALCSSPRAWCCQCCCLVGTDFTFLPTFCENCSTFAGSGDFETGTALSSFSTPHLDPQTCEGKKETFQWLVCIHFFIPGIR